MKFDDKYLAAASVILIVISLMLSQPDKANRQANTTPRNVQVLDGDTIITQNGEHVRLVETDAPEKSQPFGPQAAQALQDQIQNQNIEIMRMGTDKYGRTLAKIYVSGRCINEFMVSHGYAWADHYHKNSGPYIDLETSARASGLGLWASPEPVEPWKWRQDHR